MKTLPIRNIQGARKMAMPAIISPQLASLVKAPPRGDNWLHEIKYDGYRMLCRIQRGVVTLLTRNGNDWTKTFPNIVNAVKTVPITNGILDGEIIVVDAKGHSSFQNLQRAIRDHRSDGFVFEVFDLVYANGFNLTRASLLNRKLLLKTLVETMDTHGAIRYSEHLVGDGRLLLQQACANGLEGIVSKLADSTYDSTRNRTWQKLKCTKRQEFLIVGYTPSLSGLPGFGALILGYYDGKKLVYAGRVGTGFTFKQRSELKSRLDQHQRVNSGLAIVPNDPALRAARWTRPTLVAEVAFTEWTSDGRIRHPSFKGLREDKSPKEIFRESPILISKRKRLR